jgi:magnesium transporter
VLPNLLPDVNAQVRDLAAPACVWLREFETVTESLARIRTEPCSERVVYFYVTDSEDRLVGVAPVRKLLLAPPSTLVGEVMVNPVCSVQESDLFGSALPLLVQHRLLALPVIDEEGRLTGVLDLSNATHALSDLERREASAELFQIAGLRRGRQRAALLTSMALGIALALIATIFYPVFRRAAAVAFFIPSVVTVAGNAAMQAVTISLQGVHVTRRKRRGDLRGAVWFGAAGSAIAGIAVAAWLNLFPLAIAVTVSLLVACVTGAALGRAVPRLVHRWRLDLKVATGPLASALADIVALACYLAASALLV